MLLANSVAAISGPSLALLLRKISEMNAIKELVAKADPSLFIAKFG
jgi:hypothetical protein